MHPFIVDLTRRERETARVPSKIVVDIDQKDFYFLKTKTLVHWAPISFVSYAITFLFNVPIVSTCNKQIAFG